MTERGVSSFKNSLLPILRAPFRSQIRNNSLLFSTALPSPFSSRERTLCHAWRKISFASPLNVTISRRGEIRSSNFRTGEKEERFRGETTVFGGASTERNTGKDKVGLVNAGIVRRGIKRVFLPRRLSSVVFLATGVSPVYGRNKREKYYRPFVSS